MKSFISPVLSILLLAASMSHAQTQIQASRSESNEGTEATSPDCTVPGGKCFSNVTGMSLTEDRERAKRIVNDVLAGLTPETSGRAAGAK